MLKSRLFLVVASLAVVAFFACGQQALAQGGVHHLQARVMHPAQSRGNAPAVTSEIFQLSMGMGVLPPVGADGGDSWPCFGGSTDCSTIAAGGVVIGNPAYTQSLAACDDSTTTVSLCGQIFWFYEDDTGDNTDHLIVSIAVKQGLNYILDTGNFDFGANPFPAGSVIVISDDVAFGTLGATGKNNGFCAGSNKICVNPVAGLATVTVSTKVGLSKTTAHFNINLQ
jgi:hypothetical protein